MFNPYFADNNVVDTAVDILPRVSLTVSALTSARRFTSSHLFIPSH